MKGAYEETDWRDFPAKISSALVEGMEDFNKKIRGFRILFPFFPEWRAEPLRRYGS